MSENIVIRPEDNGLSDQERFKNLERRVAKLEDRLSRPRTLARQTKWTETLPRCVVKCFIKLIVMDGFRGKAIVVELKRLLPFLDELFDEMPSDEAIISRGYWGSKEGPGGSVSEWPEIHPKTAPFWEVAKLVYERGTPLTREELRHIVEHKCLPIVPPTHAEPEAKISNESEPEATVVVPPPSPTEVADNDDDTMPE